MTYYYLFKQFSVFLTIAVLGIMMCIIIYKKVDLKNIEFFLLTTAWTVFTCIMFLSSMHERYGYLLDIILIVYAAVSAKHLWIPIAYKPERLLLLSVLLRACKPQGDRNHLHRTLCLYNIPARKNNFQSKII